MRATFLGLTLGLVMSVHAQLPKISTPLLKSDTALLRFYADEAASCYKREALDSMQWFVNQGVPLAKKFTTAHSAPMYFMAAMYHRRKSQYDSSLSYCQKALALLTKQNEVKYCARVRYGLAVILADRYEYATAFAQCQENIRFYEQHKVYDRLSATYGLLAHICKGLDLEKQVKYYEQKEKETAHLERDDVIDKAIVLLINEGMALDKNAQHKEAYRRLNKALEIAVRQKAFYQIPAIYNDLAQNLYLQRQYPQALQMAKRAEYFSIKYQFIFQEVVANFRIAEVYKVQGNKLKTLQVAQKAYQLALKSKRPELQLTALSILAQAQKANQNTSGALKSQEWLLALKDSLATQEQSRTIEFYEADQELRLRQLKETQLKKDLQIKQLQLEKSQNSKNLAWAVAIISFLIVGLAVFFWQRTRAINQQLQSQKLQIQAQSQQLAASNLTKDKLFSIIGHDLKAPLASFTTQLTLLEKQLLNTDDFATSLHDFKNNLNQLSLLIDSLLFWSLSQQNKLTVTPQNIPLKVLWAEVLQLFVGTIHQKSLRIDAQLNDLNIYADEQHSRIILCNALQNAIKFSPHGGFIDIKCKSVADKTSFTIINSMTTNNDDATEGTGLGLLLVDDLITKNGGRWHKTEVLGVKFILSLQWPAKSK
jgi:two-component system, sensor histidine kinase and response regulator